MDGRLRVFISSTMRDLANERAEVIRQLEEMNLHPVAAGKRLLPTGETSWDRLVSAIEECDLFVLILGESYGWIPSSGPMADEGKSVTHLEFQAAQKCGVPVLVFVKRLDLSHADESEDAQRRDRFRSEVEEWDGGLFRSEFDLARDLGEDVQRAVTSVIADKFRAAQLQERRSARQRPARASEPPATVQVPDDLVEAVADGSAVVLLGAGASLEAGTPSAKMFIEAMARLIREMQPGYEPSAAGTTFNAVATDFESLLGPEALQNVAESLVDPPFAQPTPAHRLALSLFDTVITTNYDLLLEKAMIGSARQFEVIDGAGDTLPGESTRQLFKLHGSIARPDGLILTESELANFEVTHETMWKSLVSLLSTRPLLSIGSSLRDPSLIRLLEECRPQIRGWAVIGEFGLPEERRLQRWNLRIVPGDANSVLSAIADKLPPGTGPADRESGSMETPP